MKNSDDLQLIANLIRVFVYTGQFFVVAKITQKPQHRIYRFLGLLELSFIQLSVVKIVDSVGLIQ